MSSSVALVERSELLGFIARNPGASSSEIAKAMGIHAATAKTALDGLYAQYMVVKKRGHGTRPDLWSWYPIASAKIG